jgi:hypothetical protein
MRTLLTSIVLFVAAGAAPAADPPAPTVKAYLVTVLHPQKDFDPTVAGGPYVNVGLLAKLPDRSIIGLDPAACKLTLTDDKGTDLSAGRQLVTFPGVRTDPKRTQAAFNVVTTKSPAAGATKVRVKGEVVFLCGVGEKTTTAQNFVLRAKEKATAGPAEFEVMDVNQALRVRMLAPVPSVKTVAFLDRDQKSVGTLPPSLTVLNGKVVQSGYGAPPANAQAVTVSVVHYEKVEPVTVPVDTEIGIGPGN